MAAQKNLMPPKDYKTTLSALTELQRQGRLADAVVLNNILGYWQGEKWKGSRQDLQAALELGLLLADADESSGADDIRLHYACYARGHCDYSYSLGAVTAEGYSKDQAEKLEQMAREVADGIKRGDLTKIFGRLD